METLTPQQAQDIVIYGTLALFLLTSLIVGLMVLANSRDMKRKRDLEQLKVKLNSEIPSVAQMVASMNA